MELSRWLRKSTAGVAWGREHGYDPGAIPVGTWPDDGASLWLPDTTRHETYQLLPPLAGALMATRASAEGSNEAARVFGKIRSMRNSSINGSATLRSVALLNQFGTIGFERAMRGLLTFLSVAQLDPCLHLLSSLDTSKHPSRHSSTSNDERARLKKTLLSDRWVARLLGSSRAAMGFGRLPENRSEVGHI